MHLAIVTIIIFLALLAAGVAVVLAVRGRADADPVAEPSLRRQRTVADQTPATTAAGQLDQGFDRLVLESGLRLTSLTVSLLMLAAAILAGGVVLLVREDGLSVSLAALVGFLLPLGFLTSRRRRRLRQIEEELPGAIDMMARSVHAGGTLEQAINLVAEESSGPLQGEFQWCARQLQLGLPVSGTMRALSSRTHLLSVRTLATALAVHRQTGGNLASTLERLSDVARHRLAFQRQLLATTGAGRLSAYVIAAAGPVLFVALFLIKPDHIQRLLDTDGGRIMVTVGVLLEILGVFWLTRLMRVER